MGMAGFADHNKMIETPRIVAAADIEADIKPAVLRAEEKSTLASRHSS